MGTLSQKVASTIPEKDMPYQERWDKHTEQDFLWAVAKDRTMCAWWRYAPFRYGKDFLLKVEDAYRDVFREHEFDVLPGSYLEFVLNKLRSDPTFNIECKIVFGQVDIRIETRVAPLES